MKLRCQSGSAVFEPAPRTRVMADRRRPRMRRGGRMPAPAPPVRPTRATKLHDATALLTRSHSLHPVTLSLSRPQQQSRALPSPLLISSELARHHHHAIV